MNDEQQDEISRSDDPVRDYYAEKKTRYLQRLRSGTPAMTTGTPHDWQDAQRYREAAEGEGSDGSEEAGDGA